MYAKAVENFDRLKREAPLVVEDTASLYVYRLRMGEVTQTGVAACFSLDEYDRDVIKKHERTRQDKEDDRTRHLVALRAQTGPVFLIHEEAAAIDRIVAQVANARPLCTISPRRTACHTRSGAWMRRSRRRSSRRLALCRACISPMAIIVRRARRARDSSCAVTRATPGEWDTFLAVAFPAPQVRILPYNRLVTDLGDENAGRVCGCGSSAIHGAGRPRGTGTQWRCVDVPERQVAHHRRLVRPVLVWQRPIVWT